VESALKELGNPTDVSLVKKMTPLPQLELDREQMQKVFVNLLVNASEASETGGQIRVGSEQRNGDVIVSVQDDGCGMAPEFLKDRLFKPFQTTKKKGIGIGMFQSKMIVEAHGGRIEVDSKKGEGTTFRIVLPLKEGTH
jgi:signal transduction histidine kinase